MERGVHLEQLGELVFQDAQDHKDHQDLLVRRGIQARKDLWVDLARMALREALDHQDLLVHRDLLGMMEIREKWAALDRKEVKVTRENQALQDPLAPKVQ